MTSTATNTVSSTAPSARSARKAARRTSSPLPNISKNAASPTTPAGSPISARVANNTPSAANIVAYADIVRERSILRRLIQVSGDIIEAVAYSPEVQRPGSARQGRGAHPRHQRAGAHRGGSFQPLNALLTKAVDRIDKLFRFGIADHRRPHRLQRPRQHDLGLQAGDLVIVAGRPSMGKTSLAMNIAENAAVGNKLPVAIFSMEMPGEQLAMRMMASLGRINAHNGAHRQT